MKKGVIKNNRVTLASLIFFSLIILTLSFVFALSSVEVTHPESDTNRSGIITLNATTDEFALNVTFEFINSTGESFNFTITNNTVGQTVFANETFDTNWVTDLLNDGIFNISIYAHNGTDSTVSVNNATNLILDNTSPSVIMISPIANANLSGDVILNASVIDSVAGVDKVFFRFTNSSGSVRANLEASKNGDYYNYTVQTGEAPEGNDGVYNITVVANDSAGNINNTEFVTVTIDNTPPVISLSKSSSTITSITLSYSCSDATSGVST